jgi:flagellin
MSLGVLNNLSATYAENNLNNTSNSLNTVLQQLSSGSKINSGADDAAGLSLVNGLQANQQALNQSTTNASEGVGLLQVADGALSQVTSLLNRAVTLATEASNGTLNTAQDTAANQEYQSILSEISNIGSTTTYNDTTVFGQTNPVSIYTGDSSSQSASVDQLSIGDLSSSDVGQTSGTMSYNAAQTVSISMGSVSADSTTKVTGTTADSLTFTNAAGTTTTLSTTTGETAAQLVTAINGKNLGVTASFVQGSGTTDSAIVISGNVTTGTETGTELKVAETTTGSWVGAASNGTNGMAEISYSSSAGANLSSTDLSNQSDAESALTTLNSAISDVAAQDGYVGAQINTLNSVSSVLSTQQENVQSAQNAVQATDYSSATSNMSKYEILSQTGIAALAQANSMQQEVTKLLQ